MPVIINELEVIAPPPPDPEQEARQRAAEGEVKPQPGPTPEDVYYVMRRFGLRQMRLRAD